MAQLEHPKWITWRKYLLSFPVEWVKGEALLFCSQNALKSFLCCGIDSAPQSVWMGLPVCPRDPEALQGGVGLLSFIAFVGCSCCRFCDSDLCGLAGSFPILWLETDAREIVLWEGMACQPLHCTLNITLRGIRTNQEINQVFIIVTERLFHLWKSVQRCDENTINIF